MGWGVVPSTSSARARRGPVVSTFALGLAGLGSGNRGITGSQPSGPKRRASGLLVSFDIPLARSAPTRGAGLGPTVGVTCGSLTGDASFLVRAAAARGGVAATSRRTPSILGPSAHAALRDAVFLGRFEDSQRNHVGHLLLRVASST